MDAYLDCAATGISGDKFLAATIDAGASIEDVRRALEALDLGLSLTAEKTMRGGIRALLVEVTGESDPPRRTWSGIRELLGASSLQDAVRDAALAVFEQLAQAEAAVHGIDAEDVHFHEVGAADAIGEIVGVAAALESLGVERLFVSTIAVGSGCVDCEHGTLPIPAPATALLLRDVPMQPGNGDGELTTPTGAALAGALAASFGPMPKMTSTAIGHGAGSREMPTPNIARLFLGDAEVAGIGESGVDGSCVRETVILLSTTIDHITGEQAGHALERILDAGALDVWIVPTLMKKGRPGMLLEALALPDNADAMAEQIMCETGTLGVRMDTMERMVAPRRTAEVETEWGPVRVKVAKLPDGARYRAEMEDCSRIAGDRGLRVDEVARAAEDAARE